MTHGMPKAIPESVSKLIIIEELEKLDYQVCHEHSAPVSAPMPAAGFQRLQEPAQQRFRYQSSLWHLDLLKQNPKQLGVQGYETAALLEGHAQTEHLRAKLGRLWNNSSTSRRLGSACGTTNRISCGELMMYLDVRASSCTLVSVSGSFGNLCRQHSDDWDQTFLGSSSLHPADRAPNCPTTTPPCLQIASDLLGCPWQHCVAIHLLRPSCTNPFQFCRPCRTWNQLLGHCIAVDLKRISPLSFLNPTGLMIIGR